MPAPNWADERLWYTDGAVLRIPDMDRGKKNEKELF
jgi:hypothetical protein